MIKVCQNCFLSTTAPAAAIAMDAMSEQAACCELSDFGVLRFRGPDARRFLQGQLSNDLEQLSAASLLRAGLHNPQGRTLALLWLALAPDDELMALLPRELCAPVSATLRRYVLRARVQILEDSALTRVYGLCGEAARAAVSRQPAGSATYWHSAGERAVTVLPVGQAAPPFAPLEREQWRALDIAAGLPQVYAATSGLFIAQMLNLDCVDAVSFDKGCYTGQEVIARAHFRGQVKRRMQRFVTLEPAQLAPGDAGTLADGRAFRVVEGCVRAQACEFLAVCPLPGASEAAEASAGAATARPTLAVRTLPLPYALPHEPSHASAGRAP